MVYIVVDEHFSSVLRPRGWRLEKGVDIAHLFCERVSVLSLFVQWMDGR